MDHGKRNQRAMRVTGIVMGVGVATYFVKRCVSSFMTRSNRSSRCLNKYEKSFRIPDSRAISLVKDFEEQLQQGLAEDNASSLKMMPSWITALPTGFEKGEFFAIDVGGTNLRIMHCVLGDLQNEIMVHERKEIEIPAIRKSGPIQNLFDFIVTSFKVYMEMSGKEIGTKSLNIGFCFSFPLKMHGANVGFIEQLTKGFAFEDAIGKDAVQLLKNTFKKNEMEVDIRVICNDTLGVLAAGKYADQRTEIGIVLGTGTNAACVETVENIKKWVPGLPKDVQTAVNIEWGDFSSEILPRVEEDFILDRESQNSNKQLFEKMICGDYLGELSRLLILSLYNDGSVFRNARIGNLQQSYSMTLSSVCKIVSDETPPYENASSAIRQTFDIVPNQDDVKLIKKVCEIIVDRAALLVACALAATVYHVRRDGADPGHPVVVTIDGSSYLKFERFRNAIMTETNRMLQVAYGCGHPRFEVLPYAGGSCFGAAVLAAASLRKNNPELEFSDRVVELPYLDH